MNRVYAVSFKRLGSKKRQTVLFMSTEQSYSKNLDKLIVEYVMDKRTLKFPGPTIPTILERNGDSLFINADLEQFV